MVRLPSLMPPVVGRGARAAKPRAHAFDTGRAIAIRYGVRREGSGRRDPAALARSASPLPAAPSRAPGVSAHAGLLGARSFTAYVRDAMAVDASLAGFEVEAFGRPVARAMHGGHTGHPAPPAGSVPPREAPVPARRLPPPPTPASSRAAMTPQEAIEERWAARDAGSDIPPARGATAQERSSLDAIRARHGQARQASAVPEAAGGPPARREEHPHDVFERMAAALSYANTFDAGDVRIQRRFDQMNAVLDREAARATVRAEQAAATASSQHVIDDMSLMQDLIALRDKLAGLPEQEMKEPPGPLPPSATAAPPEAGLDPASLQQDLESLRLRLPSLGAEDMKAPPGPLPPAATAAASPANAAEAESPAG